MKCFPLFTNGFKIKGGKLTAYCGSGRDVVIPHGVTHISDRAFEECASIRRVVVPGTVKRIGARAFADCENLETVVLHEGIEAIEANAFSGSYKLRDVTYPDSVTEYRGWSFYDTRLDKPVLNASGTILIYCPACTAGTEWAVPDCVQIIGRQAIFEQPQLQTLHLPEGLQIIEDLALIECGFREITIPFSVCKIGDWAFGYCGQLKKITVLNPQTKMGREPFKDCIALEEIRYADLTETDKILHLKGEPFLVQHLEDPANLPHTLDPAFERLAALCERGDPDAMATFSQFFAQYAQRENASLFYRRAANYWLYRAYCEGNAQAAQWFTQYFAEHPGAPLESILNESNEHRSNEYIHSIPGQILCDLGYAFFDPEREYEIKQFEDQEFVEVTAYYDTIPPDDEGFGMEEIYEWWFLDKNMQPIPGVERFTSPIMARNDKDFREKRAHAAACIRRNQASERLR
ncbi:MAG: leucine-rich repeat domain-containing protein [Clostridia bacterium]|nr:leucine-rich repeat domain-containing protein [Clostridia bacterium]